MKLEGIDTIKLKSDYNKMVSALKNAIEQNPSIAGYINSSEQSKTFYNYFLNVDEDKMVTVIAKYERELNNVVGELGNSSFTDKEKLLNFLEYIRINTCYENYSINPDLFEDICYIPLLSCTKFSSALFGKGICVSQAAFLADLLMYSKTEYDPVLAKTINDETGCRDINILYGNDFVKSITIDPSKYCGTVHSIKRGYGIKKEMGAEKATHLEYNLEQVIAARKRVLTLLAKKNRVNCLVDKLGIKNYKTDKEKVNAIISYIDNFKIVSKTNVDFDTIGINGRELECGKLFELMCFSCDIPYSIRCTKSKREETVYKIESTGQTINFKNQHDLEILRNGNCYKTKAKLLRLNRDDE